MYYIVPRLTVWEWASARLIKLHFWCVVIGCYVFYFVALTLGGWYQGEMVNSTNELVPFRTALVVTVLGLGTFAFLICMVISSGRWVPSVFIALVVLLGLWGVA